MKYQINDQFNCVVFEIKGDIMGGPDAIKFREDLHALIEQGKTNVIVNLAKVKFINSSGLGILIGGLTTMRNAEGNLVICEADKKIKSLLTTTQLIKVFENYPTVDEAAQSYQKKAAE